MRSVLCTLVLALFALAACRSAPRTCPEPGFVLREKEFRATEHIVLAGQPDEARIRELGRAQFEMVVSINPKAKAPPFDEAAAVAATGLSYEHLAISKETILDAGVRARGYDLLEQVEAGGQRTYLHCSSANRCAALWALYQAERKDVPPEDALAAGKAVGLTKLEPEVRKLLGLPEQ